MERVYFTTYKDVKILYIDFSNCTTEEAFQIIKQVKKIVASSEPNSLLTLTNVEGAHYNSEVVNELKSLVIHNKPYVKKGTIIGLSNRQRFIYDLVMKLSERHLLRFWDIDKAKDWLVDRRCVPRIEEKGNVEYTIIGQQKLSGKGVLDNISIGGVCFLNDKNIERNRLISLKVNLSGMSLSFNVEGVVAWTSNFKVKDKNRPFSIGVQFKKIGEEDRKKLFSYIFDKVNKAAT